MFKTYSLKMGACVMLALGAMTMRTQADVLFYGGDVDTAQFVSEAPNYESQSSFIASDGNPAHDRNYASFTVPAGHSWQIAGLFANVVVQDGETIAGVTQARYDIRSDVSEGDGGTPLYSGIIDVSAAATGQMVIFSLYPVALMQGALPTPIDLTAGDYWVAFTPLSQTQNRLLIATTNGANAVAPSPGNDFRESNFFSLDFTSTNLEPSLGLIGSAVPEPASLTLVLIGGVTLALRRRSINR